MFVIFLFFTVSYMESLILMKQNDILCRQNCVVRPLPLFLQRLDIENSDEQIGFFDWLLPYSCKAFF